MIHNYVIINKVFYLLLIMELNPQNYSIDELLNIFSIENKNTSYETIQKKLSEQIISINKFDEEELPESKEKLIEFYTKSAFSILNDKNIIKYNQNLNKLLNNESNTDIPDKNEEQENNLISENNLFNYKNLLKNGAIRTPLPEQIAINTNNNKIVRGLLNPIERETTTSILSINSKFRPELSNSSTDFTINLNEPYFNVLSLKLASFEYINSYYNISKYLRTNRFRIELFQYDINTKLIDPEFGVHIIEFTIAEGHYPLHELLKIHKESLFENDETLWYYGILELVYIEIKGKVYFKLKDNLPPPDEKKPNNVWGFNLDFTDIIDPKRPAFLNFGWLLGYKKNRYTFFKDLKNHIDPCDKSPPCIHENPCENDDSYYIFESTPQLEVGFNPESVVNLIGTHYFLLEIDDFNKNQSEVLKSNTSIKNINSLFTYSFNNIIARIPNVADSFSMGFDDLSDRIFKSRIYLGPVKISRLKIRLLDENGKVVDFQNNDIIINLEIETLNKPFN